MSYFDYHLLENCDQDYQPWIAGDTAGTSMRYTRRVLLEVEYALVEIIYKLLLYSGVFNIDK